MLANPGLWNGNSPSAPTTRVKSLWVYATPLKLDASSQLSQILNQDETHRVEMAEEELEMAQA